jgi:hypothetical protein
MNAYLFASISTISQVRPLGDFRRTETLQTWDASGSMIVVSENSDAAQAYFENWIRTQTPGENPMQIEIRKISGAQILEQLLTEEGGEPFDWPQITEKVIAQAESFDADAFQQGYWVDVEQAVRPGKLSPDVETLQRDLSQDFGVDLNWSADKQFLFIISVLSPPPPPKLEPEFDEVEDSAAADSDEAIETSDSVDLGELYETFPQARDKDAAAIIRARNSVVAAWLWRRYSSNTPLAKNAIRVDPMCQVIWAPEDDETKRSL